MAIWAGKQIGTKIQAVQDAAGLRVLVGKVADGDELLNGHASL